MVQMQANQHLLLQPWILAKRIGHGSILISGNILNTTLRVSWVTVTAARPVPASPTHPVTVLHASDAVTASEARVTTVTRTVTCHLDSDPVTAGARARPAPGRFRSPPAAPAAAVP
jgi:hypothetical protein